MTLNDASLAHFLIRPCIRWGTHCVLFFGSFQKVFPESLFIDVVFVFQFEEFNWRSCEIMQNLLDISRRNPHIAGVYLRPSFLQYHDPKLASLQMGKDWFVVLKR
jgi:hypothetical protein